jgi:hypothetical protein
VTGQVKELRLNGAMRITGEGIWGFVMSSSLFIKNLLGSFKLSVPL